MIVIKIRNFFIAHKDLAVGVGFFLLSSLYFFEGFFRNKIIWGQDTPKIVFPFIFLLDESFKNLNLPLWTTDIYFGFPIGADGQLPWFYPFSILHIFLPLHLTLSILSFLHVFLAGLFTYLFSRTINLSRFASVFAGIAFMFNGFIIAHMQYFSHIYAYAYLPLILLFIELAISKEDRFYFMLAGLSFGLQLLSGHPNIPVMTIIYVSVYTLLRSKIKIGQFFIGISTTVSVAFIVALPYVLYALRLIHLSIRGQGVDFVDATNSSFSLFDLVTFIFPNFFFNNINDSWAFASTWHFWDYWGQIETTGYVGVIILLFAFFSLFSKNWQKTSIFFALLLISFILALGRNTPLYWFLLQLPFFNGLRAPGRFLYLMDFSLVILAGFGITVISSQLNYLKTKIKVNFTLFSIPLFLTLLTLTGLLISKYYPGLVSFLRISYGKLGYVQNSDKPEIFQQMVVNSFQKQTLIGLALLYLSSILIFLYIKGARNYFFKFVILTILIFDLFLFSDKVNKKIDYNSLFNKSSDSIHKLQQELSNNSGRVYTFSSFWSNLLPNQLLVYHIPEASGFASLPLKRFEKWQRLAEDRWRSNNSSLFQLGSIKYVYSLKNGNPVLSIIDNPLPRVYMVSKWSIAKSDPEAFNFISAENFNPNTAILETNDINNFSRADTSIITPLEIVSYKPDYVKIHSHATYDGILVLTDTNYPGWKAYLNGRNVPIYQTNYLFRGIKAPAGFNIIEFKYQPKYFNMSVTLSLSLALVILFLLAKRLLKGKFI